MNNSENRHSQGAKNPYLIMMGLYLGAFVGMFGETALNIALPALTEAFRVDTSLMQWVVIGHMLVIGIVLPFASLLMKHFSVRKLAIFALLAFIVGSLICGFAPNFGFLLMGRMIQGLGPGLILPLMFSMVLKIFPKDKIGSAMGLCALIIMFAPAIGPTLAGFVIGALGWRWIFFLFAIVLAIALCFVCRYMVSPYELTKPKIDVFSCISSIVGFSGLVLGFGLASLYGWSAWQVILSLVAGIAGLVLYVFRQLHLAEPVLNLRAFGVAGFRVGTILVMLDFGITLSAMFLMPQFIQRGLGVGIAVAGLLLLPGGLMNAFFSLVSGRLYDRIGARIPAVLGFSLAAVGVVLMLFTTASSPLWYVILCHVVLLIGVPLAMSPSQTVALSSLPHELSTDGSTILNTLQQVWGAVATAVATSLLGIGMVLYGGDITTPEGLQGQFTNGFHFGLLFTLALSIVGVVLAFTLKKRDVAVAQTSVSLSIESLMKRDVYTVSVDDTLLEALTLIVDKKVSGVPVLDKEGRAISFISDGDILRYLAKSEVHFVNVWSFVAISEQPEFTEKLRYLLQKRVGEVANGKLISVDLHDSIEQVCEVLYDRDLRKVSVLDEGRLVGIINRSNIVKYALNLYNAR